MTTALGWSVFARHPVADLDEAADPVVVVGGVLCGRAGAAVAELLATEARPPQCGLVDRRDEDDQFGDLPGSRCMKLLAALAAPRPPVQEKLRSPGVDSRAGPPDTSRCGAP